MKTYTIHWKEGEMHAFEMPEEPLEKDFNSRRPRSIKSYPIIHKDENGKSIVDWAIELKIPYDRFLHRIKQGKTIKEIIDYELHGINPTYISTSGRTLKLFRGQYKN